MGEARRMFETLLIANRGEIACRVLRTARRMGVRTVAVYSDADEGALHVQMADDAVRIGPAPARDSYLDIDAILAAARRSGAQAVHPGYGFLAENADFAAACAEAALVFVGPPAAVIRAMGDKAAAKATMEKAGVPVLRGAHGTGQSAKALAAAAAKIGFPVLIKPVAGGGGKGMRVVESAKDFAAALAAAKREAAGAFGDERVLLEAYLERPRHIEVQVFADSHGNVVHMFERDCSLQRRHQKVVEEAPAPGLAAELRTAMAAAAVAAARAVGYIGAGTVEFLLDRDGRFTFMEMNTRLQVEHAVTEMITGQDLVEWQLRVAAGEPLPCAQDALAIAGHAIEVRLYAEDPARDFLPASGRIAHWRPPPEGPRVRIDAGMRMGDTVGVHYDPLLAKLIAWGEDRAQALMRLRRALDETRIAGPVTNLDFLAAIAGHPAFAAGEVDTGFVDRHRTALIRPPGAAGDTVLAVAALGVVLHRMRVAARRARRSAEPGSPWDACDGWRLNQAGGHELCFRDGEEEVTVVARPIGGAFELDLPGGRRVARAALDPAGDIEVEIDGRRFTAAVVTVGDDVSVFAPGLRHRLTLVDPLAHAAEREAGAGELTAPMPGRVIAVEVAAGDAVRRGQTLIVLEAMKMEHTITAPADGAVATIHHRVGDQVEEGAELIRLTAGAEA